LTRRYIYRSTHNLDAHGHGGNRRLAQIVELLRREMPTLEVECDKFSGGMMIDIKSILSGFAWMSRTGLSSFFHPKALRNVGVARAMSRRQQFGPDTIAFFDAYLMGYVSLFREIRRRGGRVVLFPQNLDSLTPGTVSPLSGRVAPAWMAEEIAALREADLICTISREEQWLLSIFGIESLYLPFYPTSDVRASLSAIRAQRAICPNFDKVLIIGSVGNLPTMRGMKILIEHAHAIVEASSGREVVLVGYGTEILAATDLPKKFRILGGVSTDVMDNCLATSAVCLCFQPGTSGALTRIPELLCAGVPVIANYVAARSYQNLPGVLIVETMDQLVRCLRNFDPAPFDPPAPPIELESELQAALRRL